MHHQHADGEEVGHDAGEAPHDEGTHGEGPRTMLLPVGILALLALVGGWLQFSPVWTPVTSWLEPAARTLGIAEPTSWQEGLSSALAVALGLAGMGVAYLLYGRRSVPVPRVPALQRVLEHKLYFDEAYEALFYVPGWRSRRGCAVCRKNSSCSSPARTSGRPRSTRAAGSSGCRRACCARTSSSSAPAWR